MRFGIRFVDFVGGVRDIVDLTVLAEEAGFDFAWYPHDPFFRNTWAITAAVAGRTSRIRIGSVGTNPYTTSPAEIATYLATLDDLSDGRAVAGLGLHTTEMMGWTGIDAGDYVQCTREAVDIVRRLLRGEVVAHDGAAFRWSDQCYLRFKPLRSEIPIYVCAFGADYLALSGEIGDGSLPMITPPQAATYMVPAIAAGAAAAGRAIGEIDIAGCAWLSIAEDGAAATAVMRRMCAYFGPYLEDPALARIGLAQADFAPLKELVAAGRFDAAMAAVSDAMLRLGIAGTAADVIEGIEYLAAQGITQVNLGGPLGPDPAAAIRLMGREVIPHFRA